MPAPLGHYIFALHLLYTAASPGNLSLIFSDNPVYNGHLVTLTCRWATNVILYNVSIDAFNETQRVGSLSCNTSSNRIYPTGMLSDAQVVGCPTVDPKFSEVKVSMIATSDKELKYNCSVRVHNITTYHNLMSDFVRLQVGVLPSVPTMLPQSLVFNESDSVALECQSANGKPPAHVKLTVTSQNAVLNTTEGNDSVSWSVSVPQTWHNAVALCNVTNHPNMTTHRTITVNHIAVDHSGPVVVYTDLDNIMLNCSEKIAVFPAANYKWSPPDGLLSVNASSLSSPVFNVTRGQSGVFNCTATNNVTSKTVHVAFMVIHTTHIVTLQITLHTKNFIIWALSVMSLMFIILIAIISVLYKRGHFRRGNINKTSHTSVPSQQLNSSGCGQGNEVAMTDNIIYDAFVSQTGNHAQDGKCDSVG